MYVPSSSAHEICLATGRILLQTAAVVRPCFMLHLVIFFEMRIFVVLAAFALAASLASTCTCTDGFVVNVFDCCLYSCFLKWYARFTHPTAKVRINDDGHFATCFSICANRSSTVASCSQPCFPSTAMVQLDDGRSVSMQQLLVGDKVGE